MSVPKISVLIPLYNRKHYIADCINSVLAQTFQDFEIIIRDNCSTDGSYDFVAKTFAGEIDAGKIKLKRNLINVGEFPSCNRLITDATGKYFTILHSDDLYMPYALAHLYEIAEQTNADVVHTSRLLSAPPIIKDNTQFQVDCWESNPVSEITILADDAMFRFNEWLRNGTFIDCQYNIYNRRFILSNNLFFDPTTSTSLNLFLLKWLMLAKVFVKTPMYTYIRRDAPDSITNDIAKLPLEKYISDKIEATMRIDSLLSDIAFFKDNEDFLHLAKIKMLFPHKFQLARRGAYRNGITPELHQRVYNIFRKHFGENALYPTILCHMVNLTETYVPQFDLEKLFWDMCSESFIKHHEEIHLNTTPPLLINCFCDAA